MTKEEYPGIPDRIGDYYLTDFDKNLMLTIKKLEARIIKLERLRDEKINQGDTWYWEHG